VEVWNSGEASLGACRAPGQAGAIVLTASPGHPFGLTAGIVLVNLWNEQGILFLLKQWERKSL